MAIVVKMNHLMSRSGLNHRVNGWNVHVKSTLDQQPHERDKIDTFVVL